MLDFFAPCPRGLESLLAEELQAQKARSIETTGGGVKFRGSLETAYRVNLYSRLASRVFLHVKQGPYRNEEDIYAIAHGCDWLQWFDADTTLRVDVTGNRCPLRSLDFLTLRIKDAICDYYREHTDQRPDIDTRAPKMHVQAFVNAETCTLYLDLSGEPLFKRGWRLEKGDAPLRENLAAGILQLSGWTPDQALLDPMCGSGTFVIEAAQMALHIAPGIHRHFAFEGMRNFDSTLWKKLREQALQQQRTPQQCNPPLQIFASDISLNLIPIIQANLERALGAAASCVQIKQIDALDLKKPTEQGVLLCNPPYGERMEVRGRQSVQNADPAAFFKAFSDTLKQQFSGWRACLLTADLELPKQMRLKPSKRTPLFNGALECRLFMFEMVAGSNRKPEK